MPSAVACLRLALAGFCLLVYQAGALADACPSGNLLQAARVHSDVPILHPERLTDTKAVPEGVPWDTRESTVITGDAALFFDLGEPHALRAMLLQGDHRGSYTVHGSSDGRTWFVLWQVPAADGYGMRLRHTAQVREVARWIRIDPPRAGSAYALTEVQAYCTLPAAWPPQLTETSGPFDPTLRRNPKTVQLHIAMHRISVAVLGWLVFLAGVGALRRAGLLSIAGGLALSAAAIAYLVYQGALQSFRPEGWLMAGTVGIAGTSALALIALNFFGIGGDRMARKAGSLSALAALLAGAAGLLYSLVVALLYGTQSFGIAALILAATVTVGTVVTLTSGRSRGPSAGPRNAALVLVAASGLYGCVYFFTFGQWGTVVSGEGPLAVRNLTAPRALVVFHDQFHYYIGSKYFAELGYERLYRCVAVAELENGRGIVVASGLIRDLATNTLREGAEFLDDPEQCRSAFMPARWAEFRADVDYFRTRIGQAGNEYFLTDHGYNASPFWTFANRPLVAGSHASDATLRALAGIDIGLLVLMFALMWWAFGLESATLVALLLGTCSLFVYDAQGVVGSFGRLYWLFGAVAAVCLLKRGWFVAGGAALSLAALDRIFPAALAFGPVFLAAAQGLHRRYDPRLWKMLAGAGLTAAVLGGVSVGATGGADTVSAFLANSRKHMQTPLTNHIGLPTLASTTLRSMTSSIKIPEWKELRTKTFLQRRPAYWTAVALLLAFTAWVCWRVREPWKLVIAGLLPMFCLFDLTNYYYIALILLAPLAVGRLPDLLVLLGASLASQFIGQHASEPATFPLYSLLVLGLLLWFLGSMALRARASDDPPAAATSARS
jgi:hypothetical protein